MREGSFEAIHQQYPQYTDSLDQPTNKAEILERIGVDSVLSLRKGQLKPKELKVLERAAEKGNFFDLQFIRLLREPFLSGWSVDLKRKLLRNGAIDLVNDGLINVEEEVDSLSDLEIEDLFVRYGESNPEAYAIQERIDLEFQYTRGNEHLKQLYDVMPLATIGHGERAAEQIRSSCIFASVAQNTAGIYDKQGMTESVYGLDENLEIAAQNNKEITGELSLDSLNWAVIGLKRFITEGDFNGLAGYFLIRLQMPESFNELNNDLENVFPEAAKCQTYSELTEFFKNTDHEKTARLQSSEIIKDLHDRLEDCQKRKQVFFAENSGGLTMSRDQIARLRDCLDVHISDRPLLVDHHFSLAIYLYDRHKLPPEIVEDFESKFEIEIPQTAQDFVDFEQYLRTPSAELENFLQTYKDKLPEMAIWLDERMIELTDKLKKNQVKREPRRLYELIEENLYNTAITNDEQGNLIDSFGEMHGLPFRRALEKKLNLNLADLTVREQIWLLRYLRDKKEDVVDRVAECVKKYSMDFIRTFMSGEYDLKMGDRILAMAEKLPTEMARKIFAKYNELGERAKSAAKYLGDVIKDGADAGALLEIADNILRRGKIFLEQYFERLGNKKLSTEQEEYILAELDHHSSDALLFSVAFKAISSRRELKFEDIRDVEFSTADSSALDEKTKKELLRIFVANRVDSYDAKLLKQVKQEFVSALEEVGHDFYVLKKSGEILAFLRLTEINNGNLYLGSFFENLC